jgi:hypothetical protein
VAVTVTTFALVTFHTDRACTVQQSSSSPALSNCAYIHQHFNRRFGHFARTVPRGLGMGEGYGDTVVTFLDRADNATLDVSA